MFVYAAALLDFQKKGVGVGYITKWNGLLENFTEFICDIFFSYGNGEANAWQPPPPPKFWNLLSSLNCEEGWFFHKKEELGE